MEMTDWVFLLVPLLVLPIVLLFRFVGCGLDRSGSPDELLGTPRRPYRETIMELRADIIAYWRLVDGPGAPKAKEEKGSPPPDSPPDSPPSPLDGEYKSLDEGLPVEEPTTIPGSEPPIKSPGSEGTSAGGFTPNVDSLIFDLAKPKCRAFNGGYVVVEGFSTLSSEGLASVPYPENFTIEAWIDAQWTKMTDYEHTLIGAGGNYRAPLDQSPSRHGFRIFADREDRWQVYLAPSNEKGDPVEMKSAAPKVIHIKKLPPEPTYLAVTVEPDPQIPSKKKVTLFVNGNQITDGTANSYSPPNGAPLFIGVSNMESNPSNEARPHRPVMSPIQEVVLYSKALSAEVIKKHHEAGRGIA